MSEPGGKKLRKKDVTIMLATSSKGFETEINTGQLDFGSGFKNKVSDFLVNFAHNVDVKHSFFPVLV